MIYFVCNGSNMVSNISEGDYLERMKILRELGIPDPEDYVLDEDDDL